MAATASIIIEVNDAGATQAFQRISAEGAALGNNLKPIGGLSDEAFGSIQAGTTRARESAMLLSEELGIHIPRAMQGVMAGMPGISAAMNAAFSGMAIVGFVMIAEQAGQAVVKLVEYFTGWAETAKKTMDAETALNGQIRDTKDHMEKLQEAYKLIGLQGLPLFSEKQKEANETLDAAKQKVDTLIISQAKLMKQSQETQTITTSSAFGGGFGAYPVVQTATITRATDDAVKAEGAWNEGSKQLVLLKAQVKDFEQGAKNVGKELGDAFSKEHADGIREIGTAAQEALKKLQSMSTDALKSAGGPEQLIATNLRAQEEEIANLLTFSGDEETVRRAAATATVAIEKKASDDRIKLLTDEADKKLKAIEDGYEAEDKLAQEQVQKAQEQAKKLRAIESTTEQQETAAAIALAPPWERANAKIVEDYQQRMEKINEMLADGEISSDQAARRSAAAWTTEFAERRDELANNMETFFDDITSGNIGQAFLKRFEHMVFQMLATWIAGMHGMTAASQQAMSTGGGGLLGAIFGALGLGGIFGGNAGGSATGGGAGVPTASLEDLQALGVTAGMPSFSPGESSSNSALSLIPGLGFSAGAGAAGSIGTVLPAGAAAAAAGGGGSFLAKLLTSTSFQQLALVGGAGLLINSIGKGGVGGVLEGMAGGAMIGSIIPGIGTIIGALVGGLISFISGLFGEHTGDKARKQVIEPLVAQIKVIQDSYDVFQTDYNTGVASLETLRTDSITALQKIGGKQVTGNTKVVDADVDAAELHLKTTEAERNRRAQIDFGPPQFLSGGYVGSDLVGPAPAWFAGTALHFASGGAVPAFLHPGEFVLQSAATQRLGAVNLERVNAGGSMGGDVHVHISAMDAQSFEQWLDSNGGRKIKAYFRREVNRGAF
jgi:hypothetical protein